MKDENVEFNEIRCNKLILGNEETGIIELGVSTDNGSTQLVISQRDAKGRIYIDFDNGSPGLYISYNEGGKLSGMVALSFNNEGFPRFTLGGRIEEDKVDNSISLELAEDASPRLSLIDDRNGRQSNILLGTGGNGRLYLSLANTGAEGGIIFLNTADDYASIGMSSSKQLADEDKSSDERWGVLISNRSDGSEVSVEGEKFARVTRQNKKVDTEV